MDSGCAAWNSKNYKNILKIFSGKKIDLAAIDLAREKAKTLIELDDELTYLIGDPGWNEEILVHEKMGLSIEDGKKMLTNNSCAFGKSR